MQRILLAALLLALSTYITRLVAQTSAQKAASTAAVAQLLGGKFKLNPQSTKVLDQRQAKEFLAAQQQLPNETRTQLSSTLQLNHAGADWQGVRAGLETDCGEIDVLIMLPNEYNDHLPYIYVVLPPYNNCTRLHRQLAPFIYGPEITEGSQTNHCISQICATVPQPNSGNHYQCIEVMTILPPESVCVSITECSPKRPCRQETTFYETSLRDILLMRAQ